MTASPIEIMRLTGTDAAIYREIRLEALRTSADAFASTFETESARPVGWFADRLDGGVVMIGAFRGGELVGTLGLLVGDGPKRRHKGMLVGMYVRATARRIGVGQLLLDAALALAAQSVELVQLSVVFGNESAIRLYQRAGFREYGVERRALKVDGRYYDDILMAKDLVDAEQSA